MRATQFILELNRQMPETAEELEDLDIKLIAPSGKEYDVDYLEYEIGVINVFATEELNV